MASVSYTHLDVYKRQDHNWGLSVGRFLRHPEIYSPKELAAARQTFPEFKKLDAGWVEKRADIDSAVAALPEVFRAEAVALSLIHI